MAGKHLSEDEIRYVISADSSKAQQELHKLGKSTAELRREEKARRSAMIELEATGKKNSEQYQKLNEECRSYTKQIKDNEEKMKKLRSTLDVNAMTMNQLRKYAKELSSELNNTSKAASPRQYEELESRLKGVKVRMEELKISAKSYREIMVNESTTNYLYANLLTKGAELAGTALRKITDSISETLSKSVELAESADGIVHAFERIGTQDYLQTLRDATKGTVNDVELMKAAVRARDFNIPLEDLGKYLSFAQLKAQQTGQSLDYMVDSIVTGLGRQSPQILDNLGLSMTDIRDKTKETGDFMKGVSAVVDNQLSKAGETYISAADRAAQKATELQNKQRELGEALLPLKEEASEAFGSMKISIMECFVWLINHKKTTLALSLAITALTISMTILNTAFRAWITQTTLAKVVTAAWTSTVTTLKGVYLLVAAAINTMRGSTVLATAQMRLFNMTCKSNVILLLVTALVAAGVALYAYMSKTARAKKAMVDFNLEHARVAADIKKQSSEIEKTVNQSTAAEITKVKTLQKTIHDTSKSYNQRKKAILDMQSIVPGYHASITREGRLFNENTQAIDTYIKNLRRAARAEAAYEKMKDNEKKILDAQDTITDASGKGRSVNRAASRRGVNLSAGERVEARTQVVGTGSAGNVTTSTYHVVVDKTGKVIRNIDEATARLVEHDQQWGEMFEARTKVAQDRIQQYTVQNDRLQKIIEANGGINQPFSPRNLNHNSGTGNGSGNNKGNKHTTKNTNGPDPDTVAEKRFSAEHNQDLEEAKRSYQEDTAALQEALAKKKLTQEQYNAYVSALNIQHQNNLLAIEESYQERSQSLAMKDASKKKTLQEAQDKAVADQKQAATAAYIEAEKQYYDALKMLQESAPGKPKTQQEECDAKLLILEGYYQASLQLAKDDAERQAQVQKAYEEAKAAIRAEYAKKQEEEKQRVRQEYGLDTFEDQYAAQAKKRKEDYDKGLIDKQQYEQAMAILDQQAEEHRMQIRQKYGLASQQEIYNAELELLKQHLQNKEISEAEYEEAVKNLKISKMKEAFDYYANLSGGAVQALQQAEEDNVDAKYDAEIEAARNAGKDTAELEKKKANDKLKIQKKYADVNFAIKASQIIADTATSIMKAYADLGPIAGSVAAALMGITGAAQLSAANAERQKVKKMSLNGGSASGTSGTRVATGLESGGNIDIEREQDGRRFHAAYEPDRRGFVDRPTVIVGEGGYGHSREWVASNAAVENPTVAPIIDIIDRAQRAGTIRTLDMNKFLIQQAQGRSSGGTIAPAHTESTNFLNSPDSRISPLIERLTAVLDRLADDGIPASVAIDEIERKQQLRDKARKFGSKK